MEESYIDAVLRSSYRERHFSPSVDELELRQELSKCNNGMWATDMGELLRLDYMTVLYLAAKAKDVQVKYLPRRQDYLLFCTTRRPTFPLPLSVKKRQEPYPVEEALPYNPYREGTFPDDCVKLRQVIPAASISDVAVGSIFTVRVEEVYSPTQFWILRLGGGYNANAEQMQEMDEYYTRGAGKDRKVLPGAIKLGHYCAACYYNTWYRAVIVKQLTESVVKVLFIDYGTTDCCALDKLRPLRREWALLEAQAVRARLAGVRPPDGGCRWRLDAVRHFVHLVQIEQDFVACVTSVDTLNSVLEVELSYVNKHNTHINIARELIEANRAALRSDTAAGEMELYTFPSFAALESGTVPSFEELFRFMRDGFVVEAPRFFNQPPHDFAFARLCWWTPPVLRSRLLDVLQYAYAQRENKSLKF
ncbi:tudor domain-containing protein 7A-like [Maniola hyperantus]|uniref:tudor domain-containing protein 7A-like n=1 Tax=Aphantopus hyperantus TaxID=2795564 RepID=UPI0021451EFC